MLKHIGDECRDWLAVKLSAVDDLPAVPLHRWYAELAVREHNSRPGHDRLSFCAAPLAEDVQKRAHVVLGLLERASGHRRVPTEPPAAVGVSCHAPVGLDFDT